MHQSKIKETIFLYKAVFDNITDPAIIFDKNSNINYANKSLLKTGSWTLKDLEKQKLTFLLPEKEKSRVENLVSEVVDKKKAFRNFNTYLFIEQKKEIPVALSLVPLLEKKKLVGGLAVFVDIRQIQGLIESLDRARLDLEDRVEERTKELQQRVEELDKWYRLTVGRELKMKELKRKMKKMRIEIEELNKKRNE